MYYNRSYFSLPEAASANSSLTWRYGCGVNPELKGRQCRDFNLCVLLSKQAGCSKCNEANEKYRLQNIQKLANPVGESLQ
jgi:hypothetical protein